MALRPCFLIDALLEKPSPAPESEGEDILKGSPSTSTALGSSSPVDESEEDEEPSRLSQLVSDMLQKSAATAQPIAQRPLLPITNPMEYLSKFHLIQQLSMSALALRPPFPPPMVPILRKQCLFPRPSLPGRTPRVSGDTPRNGKKYRCDVCEKTFSRSNTLITHKRIHTGEKPFKCEHCGRAFRQPGNLTRHRLTHTTVKPYVCAHCDKAFNRASNLHTHMRTHTGK